MCSLIYAKAQLLVLSSISGLYESSGRHLSKPQYYTSIYIQALSRGQLSKLQKYPRFISKLYTGSFINTPHLYAPLPNILQYRASGHLSKRPKITRQFNQSQFILGLYRVAIYWKSQEYTCRSICHVTHSVTALHRAVTSSSALQGCTSPYIRVSSQALLRGPFSFFRGRFLFSSAQPYHTQAMWTATSTLTHFKNTPIILRGTK